MTDQKLLSIAAFARRLSIGETKAKELVKTGLVASVRIGRRRLVPVESADAYADGLQREHPAGAARTLKAVEK